MCRCSTQTHSNHTAERPSDVLTLRVEDMTCGHCASAVAKAIETGLPGTTVWADPASQAVRVSGTLDLDAVRALVAGAGYTSAAVVFA